MHKPAEKPNCPHFSSGPCAKRPGWNPEVLAKALTGRSHRSKDGRERLRACINLMKEVLELPKDYRVAIVPGSDTGAFEMAMWSMLGARPVDVFSWETFGKGWAADVEKHLKVKDCTVYSAPYGELPDLSKAHSAHDIVFVWNGTTSGVKVPSGDFIDDLREGLTFCDATSSAFAMDMAWKKLDVTSFSWQKVLGGEAAHGVLVLSPKAIERLETFKHDRPIPKLFRLTAQGKVSEGLFDGDTINTPSMLCVEDMIDALEWAKKIGGLRGLIKKSMENFAVMESFVKKSDFLDFLAKDPACRSNTSFCMTIKDPAFKALSDEEKSSRMKAAVKILEEEKVGFDLGAYRDAPPGFRIWCGATVEKADLEKLCPWLEYAYRRVMKGA